MNKRSRSTDGKNSPGQLKAWIANEAARIYVTERSGDLHQAKLKAAQRIGNTDPRNLPSNEELELAIRSYQSLFNLPHEAQNIQALQQKAITALTFFDRFNPRIVGALVNGTATSDSAIYLHLFSDHAEAIDWFLLENKLPYDEFNKIYYINNQTKATSLPAYRFIADDTAVELTVFPAMCLRQPVRCSVKGQPLQRESLAGFKRRLQITG